MQAFDYVAPTHIEDVVSLLSNEDGRARILCGGTDLLVQLREGRRKVELLVDVKKIPELTDISYDANTGLSLGAAASCQSICSNPAVLRHYPGIVDAVRLIGGVQIQNRASIGGNLCNASPAADSIPALIVHEAVCLVAGPQGQRKVLAEAFCAGPGQTVLQRGEFLVSIALPAPKSHFGASYLRFIPRNEMDIAVVGVGAGVLLDESGEYFSGARIALGAVAPTPLLVTEAEVALMGKKVSDETILEAARIAQETARPISDLRGTAEFRRHLCFVLVRRALEKAMVRAKA